MWRSLVLILVGLPLLAPPGVCTCHALAACTAQCCTHEGGAASGGLESGRRAGRACGCSCRRHQTNATRSGQRLDTLSAAAQPNDARHRHPSRPGQDRHAPDCPAARADLGRSGLLRADLPVGELDVVECVVGLRLATGIQADNRKPERSPGRRPHIYLTFQTLLI